MGIDRSTIWPYEDGEPGEYYYSRYDHLTGVEAERALGELEGGQALLYASGSAASTAADAALLGPGRTVALAEGCYYGTAVLLRAFERWGVRLIEFDQTGKPPEGVDLIWLEAPSNPYLTFPDIEAACRKPGAGARGRDLLDPGPLPLASGADVVLHSATKYLGGHHDVLLGALVFADDDLYARVKEPAQPHRARGRA